MKRLARFWDECNRFCEDLARQHKIPVTQVRDIFGLSSLVIECTDTNTITGIRKNFEDYKKQADSPYFANNPLRFLSPEDDGILDLIKEKRVQSPDEPNAFIVDRLVSNESWKQYNSQENDLPPIINFYSFKGGVGRTTCAALTALLMAREGKKVLLLDLDLEAPGIEDFFFSKDGDEGQQIQGGIVDFFLEHKILGTAYNPNLSDFVLTWSDAQIRNMGGSLLIVPAGIMDKTYIDLLGRVNIPDLARKMTLENSMVVLLKKLAEFRSCDYIITDCRTGFTDLGGLTLNGLSTLDVLVFKAGERDRRFLPLVLQQMKEFHQKGTSAEKLAQKFLILFNMVELPSKKEEVAELTDELRGFVKKACYDHIFEQFSDYTYPDDLAKDSPLESIPHDYVMIPYLSAFSRAILADDLVNIQAREINSPFEQLVRRILDVKLSSGISSPIIDSVRQNNSEANLSSAALDALEKIVASPEGEAEFTDLEQFKTGFLIRNAYRPMLEQGTFLILGRKGSGKSALFMLLQQPDYLKELTSYLGLDPKVLNSTVWRTGFGAGKSFPGSSDLSQLFQDQSSKDLPITFWRVFAAHRLMNVVPKIGEKLQQVLPGFQECLTNYQNLEFQNLVSRFFDQLEDELERQDKYCCLCYDRLDVGISADSQKRTYLLSALVSFWQEFRTRYRRIKARIFLREDIYSQEISIPDKAKIRDNIDRVTISWSDQDIYRVLLKRLGHRPEIMKFWSSKGLWDPSWDQMLDGPLGFIPPEDEAVIRNLVESIAGQTMAGGTSGYKKGYVYSWILEHLKDSVGTIRPRQMLLLFSAAARVQKGMAGTPDLLTPNSLRSAIRGEVSLGAIEDLEAEFKLAWTLPDHQEIWLPKSFAEFERIWPVTEKALDQHLERLFGDPTLARSIREQMVEAGLLRRRSRKDKEKEFQIPDIYLYGLGLTRRG